MRRRKAGSRILGVGLLLAGIVLYLYPTIRRYGLERHTEEEIRVVNNLRAEAEHREQKLPEAEPRGEDEDPLPDALVEYNRELYRNGQSDFSEETVERQVDLCDRLFGYIEIPSMDVTLPLYLGASKKNMAEGAAVLGGTSLPVGGENTNSVIAGHRGYGGAPFFRDIEVLKEGDPIYITNRWATLCYRVESIEILKPSDSEKVKIRPGKDMVTLITCHPYRSHGKMRYAVYCARDRSDTASEGTGILNRAVSEGDSTAVQTDTISGRDIAVERELRRWGAVGIGAMTVMLIISLCRGRKNT